MEKGTLEEQLKEALETISADGVDCKPDCLSSYGGCSCAQQFAADKLCELYGHDESTEPYRDYATKTIVVYYCRRCGVALRRARGG